jgi:hypothetical protein
MRRPSTLRLAGPLLVAALLAGCEAERDDRVLGIDATGTIVGRAYLDRDANGREDPGDIAVGGLRIGLLRTASGDTVATATTNSEGGYVLATIAVGDYIVVVDAGSIADSLEVAGIDSPAVTLGVNDTVQVLVRLGYRSITIAEARAIGGTAPVAVRGVALNAWAAFGDSTVHLADATGTIRAIRVAPSNFAAGDTVRVVGTPARSTGNQPVLTDATAFLIAAGSAPTPDSVSTNVAARADGGARDAALVRIAGAMILDSRPSGTGDQVLTVDDGSGALEVVLDRSVAIPGTPQPGMLLDATGVLVPSAAPAGRWHLKPRLAGDLRFDYPVVSVADARGLPNGRRVAVVGIALNRWTTFGDSTVHVADATGAIRAIRTTFADFSPGDSIRVVGTAATTASGERVLDSAIPSILALGTPPTPRDVSTAAASAATGAIEAALVRIVGAAVGDTATTPTGDFRLTVDDGSGPLLVDLDRHAFTPAQRAPFVPGVTIDAIGLLVLDGSSWVLKPRSTADLTAR